MIRVFSLLISLVLLTALSTATFAAPTQKEKNTIVQTKETSSENLESKKTDFRNPTQKILLLSSSDNEVLAKKITELFTKYFINVSQQSLDKDNEFSSHNFDAVFIITDNSTKDDSLKFLDKTFLSKKSTIGLAARYINLLPPWRTKDFSNQQRFSLLPSTLLFQKEKDTYKAAELFVQYANQGWIAHENNQTEILLHLPVDLNKTYRGPWKPYQPEKSGISLKQFDSVPSADQSFTDTNNWQKTFPFAKNDCSDTDAILLMQHLIFPENFRPVSTYINYLQQFPRDFSVTRSLQLSIGHQSIHKINWVFATNPRNETTYLPPLILNQPFFNTHVKGAAFRIKPTNQMTIEPSSAKEDVEMNWFRALHHKIKEEATHFPEISISDLPLPNSQCKWPLLTKGLILSWFDVQCTTKENTILVRLYIASDTLSAEDWYKPSEKED